MYLEQVFIQNIRSVSGFSWRAPTEKAGWHVIIGDNGSGKSSVLRAIALAMVGPSQAVALRQNWGDWLTQGKNSASVGLKLGFDEDFDRFSGKGRTPDFDFLDTRLTFTRGQSSVIIQGRSARSDPERHVWGGKSGWFCASYGPFRRLTGGDKDYDKLFLSPQTLKLARHLSLFGENIALTESLAWLQDLDYRGSKDLRDASLLHAVKTFINSSTFLPHDTRLEEISPDGVFFKDGNGQVVPIEFLSDGYRSVLSMTLELVRQLAAAFGAERIFDSARPQTITVPGVVLIDEPDAHLHPTWQRRIGTWFRTTFPKMQFLVATHSPLICQSAEVGSIYRLPRPGVKEYGRFVKGQDLNRLLYGNVLDAYGSEAFGPGVERSESGQEKMKRLAELNRKELKGGLTEKESQEQLLLRSMMPTAAHVSAKKATKAS